jgi:hypothetical protein
MGARIGLIGYAEILGAVRVAPLSGIEVTAAIGRDHPQNINEVLRAMLGLRLVHVAAWTAPVRYAPPRPRFRAGDGVDVPPPATKWGDRSGFSAMMLSPKRPGINMLALAELMRLLRERPSRLPEIADKSGIHETRVGPLMRELHRQRLVHVAVWMRGRSGPPAAFYALGARRDAARPAPLTSSQTTRNWYQRKRAELSGQPYQQQARGFESPAA